MDIQLNSSFRTLEARAWKNKESEAKNIKQDIKIIPVLTTCRVYFFLHVKFHHPHIIVKISTRLCCSDRWNNVSSIWRKILNSAAIFYHAHPFPSLIACSSVPSISQSYVLLLHSTLLWVLSKRVPILFQHIFACLGFQFASIACLPYFPHDSFIFRIRFIIHWKLTQPSHSSLSNPSHLSVIFLHYSSASSKLSRQPLPSLYQFLPSCLKTCRPFANSSCILPVFPLICIDIYTKLDAMSEKHNFSGLKFNSVT